MNVLIVDDSAAIRLKLRTFLSELGHKVVGEASNGIEAIQLFKETNPDLVTMDLVMPEMGGLEAMKEILAIDPKAIVVIVTSAGTGENMVKSKQMGAFFFVVKPFTKDGIRDMLGEVEKQVGKIRAA